VAPCDDRASAGTTSSSSPSTTYSARCAAAGTNAPRYPARSTAYTSTRDHAVLGALRATAGESSGLRAKRNSDRRADALSGALAREARSVGEERSLMR
jgi:hypothetical protein